MAQAAGANGAARLPRSNKSGMAVALPTAPRYEQIAQTLRARMHSGELRTGDQLPPERELSQSFLVNRLTLRRALRQLQEQGLLARRRGAGTFVTQPKIEREVGQLVLVSSSQERRGYQPGTHMVLCEQRPATAAVAAQLALPEGAAIYFIQRVRLLNGEPVILERLHTAAALCTGIEQHDLQHRSILEVLASEYGRQLGSTQQSLEPALATRADAALLGIRAGEPVMLERRRSLDRSGAPLEYGEDVYRGDRFRFVTENSAPEGYRFITSAPGVVSV